MGIVRGTIADFKLIVNCIVTAQPPRAGQPAASVACRALVDTGATDIIIRPRLATALGLRPTGPAITNTCVGIVHQSVPYECCIYLPCDDPTQASGRGNMGYIGLRTFVVDMTPEVDVIIGMNLLSMLDLGILKDGTFTLTT